MIVITLDSLHKKFDATTTSLLETGDKTINQIQSIPQLKGANNLSKQAIRNIEEMAMAFRDKRPIKKVNSDNKYYNCHKLVYFGQDYFLSDKKLNRITQ